MKITYSPVPALCPICDCADDLVENVFNPAHTSICERPACIYARTLAKSTAIAELAMAKELERLASGS